MPVRAALKQLAQRAGLLEQARSLKQMTTASGRQDLRDNRHLVRLMHTTLRADSSCVDVGANVGSVLATIVRLAPNGRHIAVEPIPALAQRLRLDFPTVDVREVAVAAHPGTATFNIVTNAPALSGLRRRDWMGEQHYAEIPIGVETLDRIVPSDTRVAFLKIDTEGAQVLALQGAHRILTRDRPVIWLEHGHRSAEAHGTTTRDLWELLLDVRYTIGLPDDGRALGWDALSATDQQPIWTFVCRPN